MNGASGGVSGSSATSYPRKDTKAHLMRGLLGGKKKKKRAIGVHRVGVHEHKNNPGKHGY